MNKAKTLSFLFVFLLLNIGLTYAQGGALKRADKNFSKFNFERAATIYKRIVDKDPSNLAAKQKLADSYRLMNQSTEAEYWYGALAAIPNASPLNKYYYAFYLKENGKAEEAAKAFTEYKMLTPSDSRGVDNANKAATYTSLSTPNANYGVTPTNVNTAGYEFSPSYYKEGIVFIADRGPQGVVSRTDNWTHRRFYNIMYAKKTGDATFDAVEANKDMTPNKKLHEGPVCFTEDGKTMYFTRNNYIKSKVYKSADKTVKLKIFKATYNESTNKWENYEGLPFNSNEYSVAHPALSKDGKRLYFASDMPGGYGESDIYVSYKEGETWGAPINLGSDINTPGMEMFPYVDENGDLYYSSNGKMGLGGLDVFTASYANGKWGNVTNLGAPVNSNKDDFGLIMAKDGKSGYFTSDRDGGMGLDDIYSFTRNPEQCIDGYVYDVKTNERIANATVLFKGQSITTDANGAFKYCPVKAGSESVSASKKGYRTNTMNVSIPQSGNANIAIPLDEQGSFELTVNVTENGQPLNGAKVVLTDMNTGYSFPCETSNNQSCVYLLQPNTNYKVEITAQAEPGCSYGTEVRNVSTVGKQAPLEIVENVPMKKFCEGEIVEIPDIYYDLDKYYIRPDAAARLDQEVLPVLNKYPNMVIELRSHTDCRATMAYNQRLSQNRAKAAVDYLVSRGINPSRMIAKGYGESELKVNCPCEGAVKSNCTEAEHQQNRRTEFKILRLR